MLRVKTPSGISTFNSPSTDLCLFILLCFVQCFVSLFSCFCFKFQRFVQRLVSSPFDYIGEMQDDGFCSDSQWSSGRSQNQHQLLLSTNVEEQDMKAMWRVSVSSCANKHVHLFHFRGCADAHICLKLDDQKEPAEVRAPWTFSKYLSTISINCVIYNTYNRVLK